MFNFLSTVINGGASNSAAASSSPQQAAPSLFGSSFGIIIYIVFLILIFYFIIIRPQKKREKKMIEVQNSLKIGDMVLLDSGLYGKITDILDQVFMIEFGSNKGVIIPVVKQRIVGKSDPNALTNKKPDEVK